MFLSYFVFAFFFQVIVPRNLIFFASLDYTKLSYMTWLAEWLTDLCVEYARHDRIKSDRTSDKTDGTKNILTCNIRRF